MVFGQECENFLDRLTAIRNQEVERAVQTALQEQYAPFEKKITETMELVVLKEKKKKEDAIARIEAEHAKIVECVRADAMNELATNRKEIIEAAKNNATSTIDKFILGVSKLADEAKFK